MRKYVAIILVIVLSVCSGCGAKDDKSANREIKQEKQRDMDIGKKEEFDIEKNRNAGKSVKYG